MTKIATIREMQNIFDATLETTGSVELAIAAIIPSNPTTLNLASRAGVQFAIGISELIDRDVVALYKREQITPANLTKTVDGDFDWQFYLDAQLHPDIVSVSQNFAIPDSGDVTYHAGQPQEITASQLLSALNTFYRGMIAAELNDDMVFYYPFVGETDQNRSFNLFDPRDLNAAFRIDYGGTMNHNPTGSASNGTNGFGDTHCILNDVLTGGLENTFFVGGYLTTEAQISRSMIAANNTGILRWIPINASSRSLYSMGDGFGIEVAGLTVADTDGAWFLSRTASNAVRYIRPNGEFSLARTLVSLPRCNLALFGRGLINTGDDLTTVDNFTTQEAATLFCGKNVWTNEQRATFLSLQNDLLFTLNRLI